MKKFKVIVEVFAIVCCNFFAIIALAKTDQPDYAKLIPPEKLKEDLDFIFKTIEEVHPNMYAYTPKEEFKPIREQLYKDVNRSMTVLEFYKLVAPVVAALKNSHTGVHPPYLNEFKSYYKGGGLVFPLEIAWEGPIAVICKDYSHNSLAPDSELLMINGKSAQEMLSNFAELFAAECKYPYRLQYTNNPNLLRFLLFLEYGEVKSWDLKIKLNDGKVNSYTINSITSTEIIDQEEKHSDFGSMFSYHHFPDYKAVLLKIKSFGGTLEKLDVFQNDFRRFLKDTFQKIREENISNLIIDIRDNEGGTESPVHVLMEYLTSESYRLYEKAEIKISTQSSEQIRHLRQQLPDKFEGKKQGDIVVIELPLRKPPDNTLRFSGPIFVLTGSQTWSASTVFASAMKCFKVGTLVGEETPDPPTLYGSSVFSELPHSVLKFAVASKLLVAACGRADGRGIVPDYEVKQNPEDTAQGVDTALQFTLDLIRKPSSEIVTEH
ncbi:MAG: S41 family peptidase [Planctomycetota bacterium]|jgi:hypothetical protein